MIYFTYFTVAIFVPLSPISSRASFLYPWKTKKITFAKDRNRGARIWTNSNRDFANLYVVDPRQMMKVIKNLNLNLFKFITVHFK